MVDPLLASRRSFLKLLGGAAALLAVPAAPLALTPAAFEAPRAALLPPNILHALADGSWQALMGVKEVYSVMDPHTVFEERGRPRRLVSAPVRAGEVGLEGLLAVPEHGVLLRGFLRDMESRRFAISLSEFVYEFTASPIRLEETMQRDLHSARLELAFESDLEARLLA